MSINLEQTIEKESFLKKVGKFLASKLTLLTLAGAMAFAGCGNDITLFPLVECETNEDCLENNIDACLTASCLAGECHYEHFEDGTPCDDKNLCTAHGECLEGNCIRGELVKCPPPDQCYKEGSCDITTGECTYSKKSKSDSCNDGNSCTAHDYCSNGQCIGAALKECPTDKPCVQGICEQSTGNCTYSNLPDRTTCSDGTWCNGLEKCYNGICEPGHPPCDTSCKDTPCEPCNEEYHTCGIVCVFDSDCDNKINCDGEEWCCSNEKSNWYTSRWPGNVRCELNKCYDGISPCGQPVGGVLAVCDCDHNEYWKEHCLDYCRSCRADFECDDGYYCTGEERCGTEGEGPGGRHQGVCLNVPGSWPCLGPGEYCHELKEMCVECIINMDCPPGKWCNSDGKCCSP